MVDKFEPKGKPLTKKKLEDLLKITANDVNVSIRKASSNLQPYLQAETNENS